MTGGPINVVIFTKQVHQLLLEYGMVWCRAECECILYSMARVVEVDVMSAGRSAPRSGRREAWSRLCRGRRAAGAQCSSDKQTASQHHIRYELNVFLKSSTF
jgi:hypothetical protein